MSKPTDNNDSGQAPPADPPGGDGDQQATDVTPPEGATVADLWGMVKELRSENAARRTKLRELEEAASAQAQEAEARRQKELEQQGEFKTLAEERAARLESVEAENARLAKAIEDHAKAQIGALPEALQGLIPASMGALEQLDYIQTPAFQQACQALGGSKPPAPGGGAPADSDKARQAAELKQLEERARETGNLADVARFRAARRAAAGG